MIPPPERHLSHHLFPPLPTLHCHNSSLTCPFLSLINSHLPHLYNNNYNKRSRVHSPPPPSKSPNTSRVFGHSTSGDSSYIAKHSPSQSSSAAAPGADTSINSISSTHSYSSLNSSTQGYSNNIAREGTSIVSNSILNNAVNQSIANGSTGGGLNSNDSFFAVKQSNISRGISTNLLGTSPRTSPTVAQQQQQDRIPGSTNTSPSTSGSITRPPMSSQRPRDNISSKITAHIPSLANASFSSAGSPDGSMTSGSFVQSQGVAPVPLAAPSQENPLLVQGSVSTVNLSAAKGAALETTALATGTGNIAKSVPADPDQFTTSVAVSSADAQQSQQRSQQNNQSSSSSHPGAQGHDRSHGRHAESTTSSSAKLRARTEISKDAPRPSATVSPAPIPAMHWTRAKVHGQIPPKDLRAQTVNLVGESVYVFGGCDPKNCFNTLYIFDAGRFPSKTGVK